jgi:hypothetical protein
MPRHALVASMVLTAACATGESSGAPPSEALENTVVLTVEPHLGPDSHVERVESRVDGGPALQPTKLAPGEHEVAIAIYVDGRNDLARLELTTKATALDGRVYVTASLDEKPDGRVAMSLRSDPSPAADAPAKGPKPKQLVAPVPPITERISREVGHGRTVGADLVVCVTEAGETKSVRFASYTVPSFDGAIVDAVARWKHTPAQVAGRPIATCYDDRINLKNE